eukprot:TRINITY_DN1267_c0_g1_i1.p1 TRINITY_DN1267_c0_g1~~TRINITY_DN1267_c0_g1_i1.p1  ORF type:complete len:757 (+),score=148.79 TRINITY_DN1267_c0_g1_i1:340-2271(+)
MTTTEHVLPATENDAFPPHQQVPVDGPTSSTEKEGWIEERKQEQEQEQAESQNSGKPPKKTTESESNSSSTTILEGAVGPRSILTKGSSKTNMLAKRLSFHESNTGPSPAAIRKALQPSKTRYNPNRLSRPSPSLLSHNAALFNAVYSNDIETLTILLDRGYDPNAIDGDATPLVHYAVIVGGSGEVISLLISRAAEPNRTDAQGRTALHVAVAEGLSSSVLALAASPNFDPNVREARRSRTALHLAVSLGKRDIIPQLTRLSGVDLNARDLGGQTPIHVAAEVGDNEALEILLMSGAEPDPVDMAGLTPLYHCAAQANLVGLGLLLEKGVRTEARDYGTNTTALQRACVDGDVECVELLLKYGADVHARDGEGVTCLHCAVKSGNPRCVAALIDQHNFPVDIVDARRRTALFWAATEGQRDIITTLLDRSANSTLADSAGMTPLMVACARGYVECTQDLASRLSAAAQSLDSCSSIGMTALHYAAMCGSVDCVSVLINAGADVAVRDANGETPYELALAHGNHSCVRVLAPLSPSLSTTADSFGSVDQSPSVKRRRGITATPPNGKKEAGSMPPEENVDGQEAKLENGSARRIGRPANDLATYDETNSESNVSSSHSDQSDSSVTRTPKSNVPEICCQCTVM